jgi:hypothetical protein
MALSSDSLLVLFIEFLNKLRDLSVSDDYSHSCFLLEHFFVNFGLYTLVSD